MNARTHASIHTYKNARAEQVTKRSEGMYSIKLVPRCLHIPCMITQEYTQVALNVYRYIKAGLRRNLYDITHTTNVKCRRMNDA